MTAIDPTLRATKTTCPYCGVGCGVLATPDGNGGAAIAGDPDHPANFGRLCSKGSALGETVGLESRLLYPMIRCKGVLERVAWSDALDHEADRFKQTIAEHGPDSVAFYVSGQLLTEDYYVVNKLAKGFVGTANVDTNSRLCMSSSVAGHRRAFGADTVPGCYEDLDQADLLVFVGSNAAWCHPVLFQRMLKNRQERGARMIVIDPRRTDTATDVDLFLGLKPGTDTALFSGLFVHLADNGALDQDYIGQNTSGFDDALARARSIAGGVTATALATGLSEQDVATFFKMFRDTPRVVTLYSQGVNQSAQGTDKVNAILNCHLATGRIGRPGASPFSLTGQPNAMGGREVGGLANQLAAHMGFSPSETDRVRRFWNAPRMAASEGLKAVDIFEAIERGTIKALWVMATNPAVSLPRAGAFRVALKKLELFIVSETTLHNDTVEAGAHVLLPAAAWGEKDGTVTNSERRISRQRAFLPRPGEAQPDWWIVSEAAQRLGFESAFAYRKPADVFREHAALSAFENDGRRDFDLGGLAALADDDYERLDAVMWPVKAGVEPGEARFFSAGAFFTSDRRGRFIAPEHPGVRAATSDAFPLRLNPGRLRDQWHTMTRSGKSPRLAAHSPEPMVDIHPDDASRTGITDGGFAKVTTPHGGAVFRVCVRSGQQRGSIFAPIHWSYSTAADACVGALAMAENDPFSGQPELKATPARVEPLEFAYRGFALTRNLIALPDGTWFARVAVAGGHGLLFATNEVPARWHGLAEKLICGDPERAEYIDLPRGIVRIAALRAGRIEACIFSGPSQNPPRWGVVRALFNSGILAERDRRLLLSGQSAEGVAETGPIVCACYSVGLEAIRRAVAEGGAANVADIGRTLRAGTNCGSCVPELQGIIKRTAILAGIS